MIDIDQENSQPLRASKREREWKREIYRHPQRERQWKTKADREIEAIFFLKSILKQVFNLS